MKEDKSTDAINKQLGSSFEANDPILSSMSRNARLSKGAMNYSDTMEQGAQINNELVILQQFNLVAYLIVMKEFQEINRIFNNDDHLSNRLSILLEMERELEAKQQQTQYLYAEQERQRLSKNQEQVNQRSHDQDAKHRQLMNDLEMLHQLQQELQHLRETYYTRQNVLYDELATLREEQMDEMLKIARQSDDISPKQLTDLEQIHKEDQDLKKSIDKMPTTDRMGKYDWRLAQRKMEAQEEHHENISRKLKAWAHENRHIKGISPCFGQYQDKIEEKEKIIANEKREFKTQERSLQEKIETKQNAIQGVKQISECIKLIEQIDKSKLNHQERATIEAASNQLEKYKDDLASAHSLKAQQRILASCVSNLKEIDEIIKPSTSGSEPYKAFKSSMSNLEKRVLTHTDKTFDQTMDKIQVGKQAPGVNDISAPNIKNHSEPSSPHGFTQFKSTYKELVSENSVNNDQLNQLKQIINDEFLSIVEDAGIEDEDAEMIQALQNNLSKVLSCDDISKLDSELLQEIINPAESLGDKYTLIEDSLKRISDLCTNIEQNHQSQMSDEITHTNHYRI